MAHEEILGPDSQNFWLNKSWEGHVRRNNPRTKPLPKMDKGFPCVVCGGDDQVFPTPAMTVCPHCLKRAHPGSVVRFQKKPLDLDVAGEWCVMCGGRKVQMFTLYAYICHRCTLQVANRQRERKHLRSIGARW